MEQDTTPPERRGPLDGITVLDCSTILAGPLTCQILGDYGAEVIKVEHPSRPDGMRGHGRAVDGHGLWWKEVGRNKRTIGLYLGDDDGAQILRDLIATADVLVENFRPGTLERWGLGWEALSAVNPGLIVLRVTGFGQDGPYATRPAFGTLVEAMSGFAFMTGQPDGPPTLPAFGLADSIAGITGASAVSMALYHRDARGGAGQVIDLSLLEPIMTAVGPAPTVYDKTGEVQQRQGNTSSNNAPRNLYRTADDHWVAISTSADVIAERVLTLVGHPEVIDEPWFASGAGRAAHTDLLDGWVSEWIGTRSREDVQSAFAEVGAAVAPVYSAQDLVADPQVTAREMLTRVPDDDLGDLLQHNVLYRMSETPGGIRFTGRPHAADTDEVLRERLDLDPERIEDLRDRGILA
ncbi:CaiB/BaiF CoA transferase family protein [Euzebya rosea]|uniref:CaiB/BaiF CoA transferase family protein n=1 Tax=Euzebya rosea TaxID=2052804 RepID=UPI00196B12B1|nr:CoA transferase [Euzebya rosea]